jgi:hypothetical protein
MEQSVDVECALLQLVLRSDEISADVRYARQGKAGAEALP